MSVFANWAVESRYTERGLWESPQARCLNSSKGIQTITFRNFIVMTQYSLESGYRRFGTTCSLIFRTTVQQACSCLAAYWVTTRSNRVGTIRRFGISF